MRWRPGSAGLSAATIALGANGAAVGAAFEHRGMELVGAIDQRRMRIGEQFGDVEALAARRVERAVGAQAVARARRDALDRAMEDIAGSPSSAMRAISCSPVSSNRQKCIALACAEKTAILMPSSVERDAERLWRAGAALHAASAAAPALAVAISR